MVDAHSANLDGRTIRYFDSGSGWPIVLLHAFPLTAEMWRPQLDGVLRGWRLIAPDLRGFGPHAADGAGTLEDMADDVTRLMDELRIDTAIIGGLSMGGYVTLALFGMAPERFTGMILANTRAAADSDEGRAGRDRMSSLVRDKGSSAVAAEMIPKLLGKTSQEERPELAPGLRALIESNPVAGIDGAINAMKARPDRTSLLPTVGLPALVITGEEDALIPASESAEMARLLPRSQLVTIPGAGHLSNLEAPGDFNEALGNFLRANI